MKTLPRSVSVAALAFALTCVAACSDGVATVLPSSDGNVAGGVQPSSPPAGTGTSSTPPPSNGSGSGSEPGTPVATDAGTSEPDAGDPVTNPPPVIDSGTGTGVDASPTTPTGALGTCGNPLCGTDTNECGCQATDSSGNTVQMGCQAGGECICLVNQQQSDNPFDENGACSNQASTAAQFLSNCTCQ